MESELPHTALSAGLLEQGPQRHRRAPLVAFLAAAASATLLAVLLAGIGSDSVPSADRDGSVAMAALDEGPFPQGDIDVHDFPFVYVVLGPGGRPLARAIVSDSDSCPSIHLYDAPAPVVRVRAVGQSAAGDAEDPHDFPVKVCEAELPKETRGGTWGGRPLPLLTIHPVRYALVGDSGLRVKPKNDGTCRKFADKKDELYGLPVCEETGPFDPSLVKGDFQALDNWGMRAVFEAAARTNPHLVIHVGDMLYRQGPCAQDKGCEAINPDRLWGDTWRGWATDLFIPARSLLEAAPWVVVRGDHETCPRGGFGWFLFLDPSPYPDGVVGGHYCKTVTNAYEIPLLTQKLIVLDDSIVKPLGGQTGDWGGDDTPCLGGSVAYPRSRFDDPSQRPEDIEADLAHFAKQFALVRKAAEEFDQNIYISHRPLFGIACNGTDYVTLDWTMQTAARSVPGSLDRISLAIAGHMHWFQEIEWEKHGHPTQLVIGNSGTKLIHNTVRNESYYNGSLNVRGQWISRGWTTPNFGFVVLQRNGNGDQHSATPNFVHADGTATQDLGTIVMPRFSVRAKQSAARANTVA